MFALDLFNTDHERRLAEGAVDQLEQRRIDDLAMKMDDLVARAKKADTPEHKAALVKEFQKCKAERDSYYKIKDECMGYGGLGEETHEFKGVHGKLDVDRTPGRTVVTRKEYPYPGDISTTDRFPNSRLKGKGTGSAIKTGSSIGSDQGSMRKFPRLDHDANDAPNYEVAEAEKNQDIADKEWLKKMGREPQGPVGKAVATGKEAIKWLAGKGGPGQEGPTYESQKKNSEEVAESQMAELDAQRQDLERMTDRQFMAAYGMSKQAFEQKYRTLLKPALDEKKLGQNRPKLGSARDVGRSVKKFRAQRGLDEQGVDENHATFYRIGKTKPRFTYGAEAEHGLYGRVQVGRTEDDGRVQIHYQRDGKNYSHPVDPDTLNRAGDEVEEGFQDFNKKEPYEVCLAGKCVKTFDYYEDARRFHDNWKKKLYREGDKAKADKITLNPVMKEQGVAEDTGSWIVYDPATRQIKKRFKTHTAGKSYAQTHGLGFASSEYYFDQVKDKQPVAETVTDIKSEMAKVYRRLAPKIERYRDSFLAGQLYDELENIAELHGAEAEFKRMMAGARNRAHMDYDTNPGGFQNWFWYLPFEDDELAEESTTSTDAVERAILNRIMVAHTDLLMKFGPDKVMQAAEEVAYNVGDIYEIGTSDVNAYVDQVRQILGVPKELDEKWTAKYKRSIDCSHPKGFSQRAHCAGKKK